MPLIRASSMQSTSMSLPNITAAYFNPKNGDAYNYYDNPDQSTSTDCYHADESANGLSTPSTSTRHLHSGNTTAAYSQPINGDAYNDIDNPQPSTSMGLYHAYNQPINGGAYNNDNPQPSTSKGFYRTGQSAYNRVIYNSSDSSDGDIDATADHDLSEEKLLNVIQDMTSQDMLETALRVCNQFGVANNVGHATKEEQEETLDVVNP